MNLFLAVVCCVTNFMLYKKTVICNKYPNHDLMALSLFADEVKVTASRTSNDTISKGEDFTLACQVNLAGIDLDEVAWYRDSNKLPGTTDVEYRVDSNPDRGMYSITIRGADAVDTGTYRCTAVTKGEQFNASSEDFSVDVVGE